MSPTLVPSTLPPTTSTPSSINPTQSLTLGIITTIAGSGSVSYSGDNGQATSATLNYPWRICVDAEGKRL